MKVLFIIIVLLLLAIASAYFVIVMTMRRMLRAGARMVIEAAWQKVLQQQNPTLKVVEADKILDEALRLLGYAGSLGEKLKAAGPRFRNPNAVWAAHKLRNRLVHELDTPPADREVDQAVDAFHSALTDLGARL